jgi:RimJ/RimL family protein N-acetyltransferase
MKALKGIGLKTVKKDDWEFLYDLLKERQSFMNISHKKMPTFIEHIKFVESKPYSKWYIIIYESDKIGSIYLSKQDEIGIFLKKKNQAKGIGSNAIKQIMTLNPRVRYLANINPKNKKSIEFFKKKEFKLIQHTYELTK